MVHIYMVNVMGGIYAKFDKRGKKHLSRIKKRGQAIKEVAVYARLEIQEIPIPIITDPFHTVEGPCLILIGSRRHTGLGGKVEYLW